MPFFDPSTSRSGMSIPNDTPALNLRIKELENEVKVLRAFDQKIKRGQITSIPAIAAGSSIARQFSHGLGVVPASVSFAGTQRYAYTINIINSTIIEVDIYAITTAVADQTVFWAAFAA